MLVSRRGKLLAKDLKVRPAGFWLKKMVTLNRLDISEIETIFNVLDDDRSGEVS